MPAPAELIALAQGQREQHLADLRELVRIPSISTLSEHQPDMTRAAEWLADQLRKAKMTHVEILPTGEHPVVYGEWMGAPGKPTVLVYGHYDVQPADPIEEWDSDPFAAEVRGEYLYGRGASDMKAQILAQVKAMQVIAGQGDPPCNIKYLIEGEEEIGSPSLPAFIGEHKDKLACDFVLNCDTGIYSPEQPSLVYALRGLAYFELEVQGPGRDLHSGMFGGSVRNPIHVLSELIAGLHDEHGRVTLPGFYDQVRDLDEEERALIAQLPYSDEAWFELSGAKALHGEAGYTTIERVGARPSLDVNGIWGGFTGEGAKTVLPARAHAKLSTRLVADQKPEAIEGMLRAYLEARMPEGISWKLHCHSMGPGAIMDRNSPYMRAAREAQKAVFGREPLFKREGGSVPIVGLLQDALGVDSIMLGFALPDDGIHGPNEKQFIPNYFRGIETYIHFLASLE